LEVEQTILSASMFPVDNPAVVMEFHNYFN
jgi:hypothetical protein